LPYERHGSLLLVHYINDANHREYNASEVQESENGKEWQHPHHEHTENPEGYLDDEEYQTLAYVVAHEGIVLLCKERNKYENTHIREDAHKELIIGSTTLWCR